MKFPKSSKPKKRFFALTEVLVSLVLFSIALVYILAPIKQTGTLLRTQEAMLATQALADDAACNFYAGLLQKTPLSMDQLQELIRPQHVGPYSITYEIGDMSPKKQTKSSCYVLSVAILVRPTNIGEAQLHTPQAKRSCDLCLVTTK